MLKTLLSISILLACFSGCSSTPELPSPLEIREKMSEAKFNAARSDMEMNKRRIENGQEPIWTFK